jgi:hypothetical protein
MIPVNPDFRDLLAEFNAQSVEYLVVGAHALAVHGLSRDHLIANKKASGPARGARRKKACTRIGSLIRVS